MARTHPPHLTTDPGPTTAPHPDEGQAVPGEPGGGETAGEPTPTTPGRSGDVERPGEGAGDHGTAPRQTLAGRVWVAIAFATILLVALIIFIAENSRSVTVSFLGAHGHISEALALLIAVVAGIALTLLVGTARMLQLSLEVRRSRRQMRRIS